MNLRDQAERDLAITLEDAEYGYGIEAIVTNPAGDSATLNIQSGDINLLLDTDTGVSVSNREAHAAVRIKSLTEAGLGIPRAKPKQNENPWISEFSDPNGNIRKFTVAESRPDRTLGLITVVLELLKTP